MARLPAFDRRLRSQASAFDAGWLASQRWFRAKSRALQRVELIDAGELQAGSGWLLVLEATDDAGVAARYLVPAALADGAFREPRDGEGVWRELAVLMLDGGEVTGGRGHWSFSPAGAAHAVPAEGSAMVTKLTERRLAGEQSNTSAVLGEELILKVYRLIEPGRNPEVEISAFLTEVGFSEAASLAGSATYFLGGVEHSAAMLQQFVPAWGDGWTWMLDRLGSPPNGPGEALRGVAQIGRLTAALHAALASRPEAPGFPFRVATSEELAVWGAAAQRQLSAAMDALGGANRSRLASIAPRIAAGLDAIAGSAGTRVSRVHGDYHLGQLLRTGDQFLVIDFEGEPARPIAERSAPSSPLRDVAGMLRSLDYAAHAADAAEWTPEARIDWLTAARATFFDAYGGIAPEQVPLLAALELEKACYEVIYEANNRPDWIWLPLGALERLTT